MTTMMRMTEAQLTEFRAKRTNAATPGQPAQPAQVAPAKRANKYGAQKTVVDGITFDSKAEAARWVVLQQLERAGHITELRRQVRYELVPKSRDSTGRAVREVAYVADFVYREKLGPRPPVVEDVKGIKTDIYRLKAKLMLHVHDIEVREISK